MNVFAFEASLVYFIKKKLRDHVWKSRKVLQKPPEKLVAENLLVGMYQLKKSSRVLT